MICLPSVKVLRGPSLNERIPSDTPRITSQELYVFIFYNLNMPPKLSFTTRLFFINNIKGIPIKIQ